MSFKFITKITNRPNFYYFDQAILNDKRTTIKYRLFTDDEYKALLLVNKIRLLVTKALSLKSNVIINRKQSPRSQTRQAKQSTTNKNLAKTYLDIKEYKQIVQRMLKEFYLGYKDNPQLKQTDQENKTSQTQNIQKRQI